MKQKLLKYVWTCGVAISFPNTAKAGFKNHIHSRK